MDEAYDVDDINEADIVEIIELDEHDEEVFGYEEAGEGVVPSLVEFENEDLVDLSKRTFVGHAKSVFHGILNAEGTIAATGGEDDVAFVWSTITGDTLLECSGHKDSVTQLAFNFDEKLLATGDMGGLIQVWNVIDKKLIWCYEGDELEWLKWHPKANILFAGCEFGNVFLWQIPQGTCKVLPSRGSNATCGHILSDGVRLLAGYENGQVRLWDIKTESVVWELKQDIPISGLNSMDISRDDNLFVIAPSAQVLKVADGSLIGTLLITDEVEVEAVAFSDESGLVATGSISGVACIWDLKTNSIRHNAKIGAAVTSIKWGQNDTIIIGTTDAKIYVVDSKTGKLIETLTGHKLDILSLSLSKDGSVLLSTSDDGTAKIFTVKSSIIS